MLALSAAALVLAPVSFSAPAAPASRLLPALGRALGLRLEASPKLAGEVLLIQVSDVAANDLLKRVAEVTGGEWEEKDGAYRLVLTGSAEAKQARDERIARGQAWIDQVRRQAEMRAKQAYSDGQGGVSEAIIARLPPEFLGGLGFKERLVFSTRPTPMQRLLTRSMIPGVDVSRIGGAQFRAGESPAPPAGPIAVLQLVVQASEDGRSLRHRLVAADATGRVVRAETGQINQSFGGSLPKIELPLPNAPVVLDKSERERVDLLGRADPGRSGMRSNFEENDDNGLLYSNDDLSGVSVLGKLPEVLRPEAVDPLALAGGPLVGRLAEGQKLDLVADLPDSLMRASLVVGGDASSLVNQFTQAQILSVAAKNGWMTVRPFRPAAARTDRLDRAALGTALRRLATDGSLDLEARAAYASAAPLLPFERAIDDLLFAVVNPDYGRRMAASCSNGERQLLRVYRSLGLPASKTTRRFGSLPSGARQALTTFVFNAAMGPQRQTPMSLGGSRMTYMAQDSLYLVPNWISDERTVYWGNGIPANAAFRYEDTLEPAIFGFAPNGARPNMTSRGYSTGISFSNDGPIQTWTSRPRLPRYVQAKMRRVQFEISDGPTTTFARQIAAESIPANAKTIAYEELPEEMRKGIEESEASLLRSIEDYQRQRQMENGAKGVKP